MTDQVKAICILVLIAIFAVGAGFGVHELKKAGAHAVQVKDLKAQRKAAKVEVKNVKANAVIAKRTTVAQDNDAAKAAKTLEKINAAVARDGAGHDCLSADQLRTFNDPLGDAGTAGGPGVPAGVSPRLAEHFRIFGIRSAAQPGGVGAGAADVRAQPQRAGGGDTAVPQVSYVEQRLKQFFPTKEAGK